MRKSDEKKMIDRMESTIQKICDDFEKDINTNKLVYKDLEVNDNVFNFYDMSTFHLLKSHELYYLPVINKGVLYVYRGIKNELKPELIAQSSIFVAFYNTEANNKKNECQIKILNLPQC